MPLKSKSNRFLYGFNVLALALVVWLLPLNGMRDAMDWWWLRNYVASPTIEQLAEDGSYTDRGRELFYLSDPQLVNTADKFNELCNDKKEYSIVLGCYVGGSKIYIFNINDERIPDIEEVTAAHEMLHAAFERLSENEKSNLDILLNERLKSLEDQRILDLLAVYRKSIFSSEESADIKNESFLNELHSIFGTELSAVGSELEGHYSQYFEDRGVIVAKSEGYAQTFLDIKDLVDSLDSQLSELDATIKANKQSISDMDSDLSLKEKQLAAWLAEGDIESYDAAVPGFNASIGEYNSLVGVYKTNIEQYNNVLDRRNKQANIQRSLMNAIEGKFEPRQEEDK